MTEHTDDPTTEGEQQANTADEGQRSERLGPEPIEPGVPEEFGLLQIWWGDGKGKTTAAIGMGFRAAGHGYRVHMLQFLKGGAGSVEDVRGEYNAIERFPGFSYENTGHYGWHKLPDGTEEEKHEQNARAGFRLAQELIEAAGETTGRLPLDGPPEDGCHMLILDEILYALNRDLVTTAELTELIESAPEDLELVLTGSHEEPTALLEHADLVTEVRKEKHPIEAGQRARKGTEF